MAILASMRKGDRCYWSIWADNSKSLVLAVYETHSHTHWGRGGEREGGRESEPEIPELEWPRSTASALVLSQKRHKRREKREQRQMFQIWSD